MYYIVPYTGDFLPFKYFSGATLKPQKYEREPMNYKVSD